MQGCDRWAKTKITNIVSIVLHFRSLNSDRSYNAVWYTLGGFVLIHWLGVEGVQQVVRMAVAVSAHRHQGGKGGQENGGQHPNGHDHHCLHGDSGSHSGCRQQLVQEEKSPNRGRLIVRGRLRTAAHLSRRVIGGFSLIGRHQTREEWNYFGTFPWFGANGEENTVQSVCGLFLHVAHLQLKYCWSLSEQLTQKSEVVYTSCSIMRTVCLI